MHGVIFGWAEARWRAVAVLWFVVTGGLVACRCAGASEGDWPQFRGPRASGVADGQRPPERWDGETGTGVRWRTPIPGLGHASPIVWGSRVYAVTAVRKGGEKDLKLGLYGDIGPVDDEAPHAWKLYCLDKLAGSVLWERTAVEAVPRIRRHPKATHANSTPATDGRRIVAILGSEGLFCHTVEGEPVWKKDLGKLEAAYYVARDAQWGFGSSPVIHEGSVIVQCDVIEGSFLAAYRIEDGSELWRTPRDDVPTWSTPTVHPGPPRAEILVNGYRHSGSYDPATGKELWRLSGGGDIPVPAPVVWGGLVFLTSAHGPQAPIRAVRLGAAEGDITPADGPGASIAWSRPRDGNYMQTPIVYEGRLWACRDHGVLGCFDATTGDLVFRERLGEGGIGFTASAVAADGRIYFTSEGGDVHVVKPGPKLDVVSVNRVGEPCMATPAISEGLIIFRTKGHVVAFGEPVVPPAPASSDGSGATP